MPVREGMPVIAAKKTELEDKYLPLKLLRVSVTVKNGQVTVCCRIPISD